MGYCFPHWNRNDTERIADSLKLNTVNSWSYFSPPPWEHHRYLFTLTRSSFYFFFFFYLTRVKIILKVKIRRGIGRRVRIYFFEFYSQYQNTLNLEVSVAHKHSQPSNPGLCLPIFHRSKMGWLFCTLPYYFLWQRSVALARRIRKMNDFYYISRTWKS